MKKRGEERYNQFAQYLNQSTNKFHFTVVGEQDLSTRMMASKKKIFAIFEFREVSAENIKLLGIRDHNFSIWDQYKHPSSGP